MDVGDFSTNAGTASDRKTCNRSLYVAAGPGSLLQFIWYYHAAAEPSEWDVLIVRYGDDAAVNAMASYCRRSGYFNHIMIANQPIMSLGMLQKAKMFLQMVFCWVAGRREVFAKAYVDSNLDEGMGVYSNVVFECDDTILSGCLLLLSGRFSGVLLEDGFGDYVANQDCCHSGFSMSSWGFLAWFIARMGYGDIARRFYLPGIANCARFATLPDKLPHRDDAKSVRKLFENSSRCSPETILEEACRVFDYHVPRELVESDVVLFTSPYGHGISCDDDSVWRRLEAALEARYAGKRIAIKKHPRDTHNYKVESAEIVYIDAKQPGELLVPFCKDKDVVLTWCSSLCIQLQQRSIPYLVLFPEDAVSSADKETTRRIQKLLGCVVETC